MSKGEERGPKGNVFLALSLVTELGLAVAIPIVLGVVVGDYVDKHLGTGGIAVFLGVLFGVISGIYNAYRLIAKVMDWKR